MPYEESSTERGIKNVIWALIITLVATLIANISIIGLLSWRPSTAGDIAKMVYALCGLSILLLLSFAISLYFLFRGSYAILSEATTFGRRHYYSVLVGFILIFLGIALNIITSYGIYAGMNSDSRLVIEAIATLVTTTSLALLIFFISSPSGRSCQMLALALALLGLIYLFVMEGRIRDIAASKTPTADDISTLQTALAIMLIVRILGLILFIIAYLFASAHTYSLRKQLDEGITPEDYPDITYRMNIDAQLGKELEYPSQTDGKSAELRRILGQQTCPKCGRPLTSESELCPFCGFII